MAVRKNYVVFGGKGKPQGGALDIAGQSFTVDEAQAVVANEGLTWWQIAAIQDEGLTIIDQSKPETPAAAHAPATARQAGPKS